MESKPSQPSLEQERIVIVGGHTLLGELLIERLERRDDIDTFYVVDLFPLKRKEKNPKQTTTFRKARFKKLDLIQPGSDAKLAEFLKEVGATIVVHALSKNNPSLQWVYAHELEVIGTLAIAAATKAARVRKLIFCSTTAVYGASPKNPNYVSEDQAIEQRPESHFVRDKVDAEKEIARFRKQSPDTIVTTLRFCLILGPRAHNYFTELFRRPLIPTLLGYDPLMQFLHENDAVVALEKVIETDHRGTFNIVGRGVIPLKYALREAGKVAVPVAPLIAYPLIQVLWNLQLVSVPGRLLDYFRFLWVADGEKAKKVLGFESSMTSKEAFIEFAKTQRLEDYSWAS